MRRTAALVLLAALAACNRMDEAPKAKVVDTRPETALQRQTTRTALVGLEVRKRMGKPIDGQAMGMIAQNARSKQQREMAEATRRRQAANMATLVMNEKIRRQKDYRDPPPGAPKGIR